MDKENGKIPQIILDFFSGSGGRSIILKGAPGTGKTTFALELLAKMKDLQKVCFISARVEESALKNHIPWLDFNVLVSRPGDHKPYRVSEKSPTQTEAIERTELDKLEMRVEKGDESLEETGERSSAGYVEQDTLTFELSEILPEIDKLYDTIELGLPKKALVAIDSIDALSEKYGIHNKRLFQALQKDLVENSRMNAVFITERLGASELDFLGDGLISFEMREMDERRLRSMRLEKLRGFPIVSPQIPFTLDNGHFTCFQDESHTDKHLTQQSSIEIDGLLASLLGNGTYNLVEFERNVPSNIVHALTYSLLATSFSKNMQTYAFPSSRLFGENVDESLKKRNLKNNAEDSLRLLNPIPTFNKNVPEDYSRRVDGESLQDDLKLDFIRDLFPDSSIPRLFLTDLNLIRSVYGEDSLAYLETHISHLLQDNGTCIGFNWFSDEHPGIMNVGFSDSIMRVRQVWQHTVFYGEKPYTPLYFLEKSPNKTKPHALKVMI
jgi:KaiC/GvpD/RAD55 family RecA-like ATPase